MKRPGRKKATFAMRCFRDVEAAFRKVEGFPETIAGYCGGDCPHPAGELVESGKTAHAKAAGILVDPEVVTGRRLPDVFRNLHSPAQAGGQEEYPGSRYRSIIFYHEAVLKKTAMESLTRLAASSHYRCRTILIQILPVTVFRHAEESHQRFYEKCGEGESTSRKIRE